MSVDADDLDARLERIAGQATGLALRLGKQVDVTVDGNGLRFDAATWAPFWATFDGVVQNAIEHGIERPERRALAGKSRAGSLAIRAKLDGPRFVLEARDDGGGIDWSRLADRAQGRGLPSATRGDLDAALFVDGLSTRESVSELAGRGAGLVAVRRAVKALGGTVTIGSHVGCGTSVRFELPSAALGDASARRRDSSRQWPAAEQHAASGRSSE